VDEGDRGPGLDAAEAARAETEVAGEAALDGSSDGSVRMVGRPRAARATSDPDPVCPFLRLERDGSLGPPARTVDVDHRCDALELAVPVSDRQQSLVCLSAAHVDCPRYLRGTQVVPVTVPTRRDLPRATIGAIAILAISLLVTLTFTAAHGGLAIPVAASPAASPVASTAVVESPPPQGPSAAPSTAPSASPSPSPSAASAGPSSTPAGAGPSSGPTTSPAGSGPTADRLALLQPCPDRTDCYIYTVRAGDNLTSIGLFFGVPFDTILRLNPWIRDPATIHKGDRVVITTPTR
jgi:hypothetical protein